MEKENKLGTEKIFKLVFQIALPCMLAQFVSVLYSIIDRIFVGNIPVIGDDSLAGIGVCAPILTFVAAFSVLIGIGGGPLIGISLGEGNKEKAKRILSNSFVLLIGIGIAVTALCLSIREPILLAFGASEKILPYAKEYFTICIAGITFQLLAQGLYQFIIAQGHAKTGMFSIIIGAILNICLDPLFIQVFNMGVAGAAYATIISQAVSALFVVIFLLFKSEIKITFTGYSLKIMGKVCVLGISPFLIIALDSGMLIAVNAMLKKYGGDANGDFLITVNTIVQSFMLVVTMPLGGISGGTQCILSFNYGAGNTKRVISAQKAIGLLCLGYNIIMFILAWAAGQYFIMLFTDSSDIIAEATKDIRIVTLMILPLAFQYSIVDGFTALGQVKFALFLSLWRKTIYFIAVFVIPLFLAPNMIFFAEPISDILAVSMAMPFYFIFNKKILIKRELKIKELNLKASQVM